MTTQIPTISEFQSKTDEYINALAVVTNYHNVCGILGLTLPFADANGNAQGAPTYFVTPTSSTKTPTAKKTGRGGARGGGRKPDPNSNPSYVVKAISEGHTTVQDIFTFVANARGKKDAPSYETLGGVLYGLKKQGKIVSTGRGTYGLPAAN